ncbi:TonB family protein [Fulvivirgaceae bacterium PWU5]|uniref:TonB family protein n=1 Tax=Dawidia cretensis TaxID=2782350 RepID=A0AAP2E1J6_9BACT|nr:energy transducer TonB [Dawidia cretensis]MBT1709927.1 TonB family protein [Dawidia cretensis]
MNMRFNVLTLVFLFTLCQGCDTKSKEAAQRAADSTALANQEAALATKKAEEKIARRAKLAQERTEREAQRATAAAEKAKKSISYKDAKGKLIYIKPEVVPEYTGGEQDMRKYLNDNLKYPDAARDNGVEGTVFIDFVVDDKGKVQDVVASDAVGENVDLALKEEAVRVVASMPGWQPAKQKGKAVSSAFSIPITFELE